MIYTSQGSKQREKKVTREEQAGPQDCGGPEEALSSSVPREEASERDAGPGEKAPACSL